jgi:SAM-dependent methyltransferase
MIKNEFNWTEYYNNHRNSKPTSTLLKGLKYFNDSKLSLRKKSIDIGCGQGTDVAELLREGWDVLAVDKESEAEKIIIDRFSKFHGKELITQVQKMENIVIPQITLVNASFSLPFCNPNKFSDLWAEITTKLSIGGIFCGQLFGLKDSWASNKNMTFHHRNSLDSLFNNFTIDLLHEENKISKTSSGEEKNWHIFHLVAVKLK